MTKAVNIRTLNIKHAPRKCKRAVLIILLIALLEPQQDTQTVLNLLKDHPDYECKSRAAFIIGLADPVLYITVYFGGRFGVN